MANTRVITKPRAAMTAATAIVHRDRTNQGRWTVPVTYGDLKHVSVATVHRDFVRAGMPGEFWYTRGKFWDREGSPRNTAALARKWREHCEALRAHPYVVMTTDKWTPREGDLPDEPHRTGYVCLYRFENLMIGENEMNLRLVERIEISQ